MAQSSTLLRDITAPVKGLIRLSVFAGIVAGTGGILLWVGVAGAIDSVFNQSQLAFSSFGVALIGILLRSTGTWAQAQFGSKASIIARRSLRQRLVTFWATTSPLSLKSISPAARSTHLLENIDALDGYIARFLPQMSITLAVPAIIVVIVATLNWVAALLLLVSAPLIPLFMALVGMGAETISRQHWLTVTRLSDQFLDRIRGLTTLQLFSAVEDAEVTLARTSDDYRRLTLKTLRIAFLSSAVLEFFASVAIAMLAIFIGFSLLGYLNWGPATDITLYSGLLILLLAPDFFQPWRALAQHYHDRATAIGAADELAQELYTNDSDISSQTTEVPATSQVIDQGLIVRMQSIDLAFSGRGDVLSQFSMYIKQPAWIVITGQSGSGKTSVLNILAGFLTPDAGTVELYGKKPGEETVFWLSQFPWHRSGTLRENLQLLSPDASDEQMLSAIDRVDLGAFVQQSPQGLDAPIGELGHRLSGGQAQRLALARVFLSDARVILLDEPTAALDSHSASVVLANIRTLVSSQHRTVIMASHDSQTLIAADKVIHLKEANQL